jgi:hypothetical protein
MALANGYVLRGGFRDGLEGLIFKLLAYCVSAGLIYKMVCIRRPAWNRIVGR